MGYLAQATDPPGGDLVGFIGQLGVAGGAVLWALRAERRADRAEERQAASEARERQAQADKVEMVERLVPVVIAATAALDSTTRGLASQVAQARNEQHATQARNDLPPQEGELRETLRQINESLAALDARLPRPRKGAT